TRILNRLIITDTIFGINYESEFGCDSIVIYDVTVRTSSTENTNVESSTFSLFPNPTNGNVWLKGLALDVFPITVSLFSATGASVFQNRTFHQTNLKGHAIELDLGEIANGLYFLKIENKSGHLLGVEKFIKN
ncbi:MAG: T9SS type A sorting domain-containing protein, partial [Saprospiraceae bacterium]|nr:T9SS type A sorting domain-containing protein [Saprospiraceae bacterium]